MVERFAPRNLALGWRLQQDAPLFTTSRTSAMIGPVVGGGGTQALRTPTRRLLIAQ